MRTDFTITPGGSIWLLTPITPAASEWTDEHLPADATHWANSFAIEARYVEDIVVGIQEDGLTIS